MNFIIDLLILKSYNVILIMIDHLSKKRHYISYIIMKDDIILEETA
jgi:hypothetical protein